MRITVSYDGTDFHGWQVQPGLPTVQAALEAVLSEIEEKAVAITGSGRTDAGVHALAQVASFDLANPIPNENLRRAMNRLLPHSIRILDVQEAAPRFHARYDAVSKTYEYRIFRDEVCPPFERRYVHHHPYPMDHAALAQAAKTFEGSHDFRAFAAADERYGDGYSTIRTIFSSSVEQHGARLIFRIRGTGFLKHMVRNLAGTLIEAGRGNIDPGVFPARCGATAPACGLFLVCVEYPNELESGT